MVSEAKKASNAAWDKDNMVYQTVKVRKEILADFKAAVASRGERVNTVLRDLMVQYTAGGCNVTEGNVPAAAPAGTGILTPAAEDIARAAADRAGMDPAEWVTAAIQEQSARDARTEELRRMLANKERK